VSQPTPTAPEPTPTASAIPAAAAAPMYVPPPQMAPAQPAAPAGPQYVPVIPTPPPAANPDDDARDITRQPQWVQDQIAKLKDENARRRISERTAVVNQHAIHAAAQLNVNIGALLDSAAFNQVAAQLDPTAADFPQKLTEAINGVVRTSPWMATPPSTPTPAPPLPPPPTSGADFAGAAGGPQPVTEAQLAQMTHAQVAEAYNAGKLKHLM
jgi:hypothetical protein